MDLGHSSEAISMQWSGFEHSLDFVEAFAVFGPVVGSY